jgi:hypothetical protein
MFDAKSRYAKADTYYVEDARGREVQVVATPDAPDQTLRGIHVHKDGERADHLASRYTADPAGYWRLAEFNDAMTADVLAELPQIRIPTR